MDRATGNTSTGAIVKDTKIKPNCPVHVEFTWESEAEATGRMTSVGATLLQVKGEPNTVKRALADALQRLAFEPSTPLRPIGSHRG